MPMFGCLRLEYRLQAGFATRSAVIGQFGKSPVIVRWMGSNGSVRVNLMGN